MSLSDIGHFLWAQFQTVPLPPPGAFAGQTVLVTGANSGLGLEAVRHVARLGAARVLVACRSVAKAEAAIADVQQSLAADAAATAPVFEAWDVDMGAFASVAALGARAAALARLDAVVLNAGVAPVAYAPLEGHESTITVNVLSTFYLALLLLPVLRRTAATHNVRPRVGVVSSDAHAIAAFAEAKTPPSGGRSIFAALDDPATMGYDRYNTSKLIEVLVVRALAADLDAAAAPAPAPVVLNTTHPGLCRTSLMRSLPWPVRPVAHLVNRLIGRSAEAGARTLVFAAAAGPDTHGQYLDTCAVRRPSAFVTSPAGQAVQRRVYAELLDLLEGVHPGLRKNVGV